MRMLCHIRMPHEPFNTLVRNGTAGEIMGRIVEDAKPESIYFTEHDGTRGAVMVIQVENASQIPKFAEPWFLHFNADCKFRIAMSPQDLQESGLDKLGKKWS